MQKRVAIVGAGASGLLCAIVCAQAGIAVDIYEQNAKPAKKILVSGNGRCNISNTNLSVEDYFGEDPAFVAYALEQFGFEKFQKFMASLGLILNTLEDGRAYPLSNEAKSVAALLQSTAQTLGVSFHLGEKITNLQALFDSHNAVVVATGSQAAQHLGGNNDAAHFAKMYGHTIVPTYPSLVQLELPSKIAHTMSGTKIVAEVSLLVNGQKESMQKGDVLFTNYGVSGFAILDLSQAASKALLEYSAVDISLNLLPDFTPQKLANHIIKVANSATKPTLLNILVGMLPLKIAQAILSELALSPTLSAEQIHTKLAKKIANLILHWKFEVSDTHGFRHAEVSGGGINTAEIDAQTMMSQKCKNLYFCGEALDIVGKRGGYNFAFAWASAYLAAKSIINYAKIPLYEF